MPTNRVQFQRVAIPYHPDWIDGEPTPESVHRVPGATIDGMLAFLPE
ncbi:hypothetical protein [Trinickia mobilis]|nr:hypothetical protein [Trinickia mobilis]